MFGFFAGAVGAYVVFRVMRHRHGWGGGGGRGGWRRMVLGRISERLDATPAQERVIDEVMDSVRRVGESFRSELEKTREAAAKAARAESFDATALREAWARHDALIAEFRAAVVDGLRKVHEALQPRQRQTLAELVEGGWRGFARGGRRCGGFAGHSQQHRPYGDGYAA